MVGGGWVWCVQHTQEAYARSIRKKHTQEAYARSIRKKHTQEAYARPGPRRPRCRWWWPWRRRRPAHPAAAEWAPSCTAQPPTPRRQGLQQGHQRRLHTPPPPRPGPPALGPPPPLLGVLVPAHTGSTGCLAGPARPACCRPRPTPPRPRRRRRPSLRRRGGCRRSAGGRGRPARERSRKGPAAAGSSGAAAALAALAAAGGGLDRPRPPRPSQLGTRHPLPTGRSGRGGGRAVREGPRVRWRRRRRQRRCSRCSRPLHRRPRPQPRPPSRAGCHCVGARRRRGWG
jgi:hypothetical protein